MGNGRVKLSPLRLGVSTRWLEQLCALPEPGLSSIQTLWGQTPGFSAKAL